MKPVKTYCDVANDPTVSGQEFHKAHHDLRHGYPCKSDDELFGRLVMEINQAGLSWLTILKREKSFYIAYDGFKIAKVALYDGKNKKRLLNDAGVIRNRLKIDAAIHNARVILRLQKKHGSFKKWLDSHHPKSADEWVKIFREIFHFTGYQIVNEFMMSAGYLPGAHHKKCAVYRRVLAHQPAWARAQ